MTFSIPIDKTNLVTIDSFCTDTFGETPAEPEPRYPTGMGELTFEELVSKTRRVVGNTLRQAGMDNPDDIDDALQSGYMKVYRRKCSGCLV